MLLPYHSVAWTAGAARAASSLDASFLGRPVVVDVVVVDVV
jgi:hypothetical protein